MLRTYSELMRLKTFDERFDYLQIKGRVGEDTFGFERYLNQKFYTSTEWKQVRRLVIARDLGNDLGLEGYPIFDRVIIHHMNPMVPRDVINHEDYILDPDMLITCSHQTHNAIHYGGRSDLRPEYVPRRPGDTTPW